MNRYVRSVIAFVVLAGLVTTMPLNPARAAGVVGTGTPGSCDETALDTALAGGGAVTFDCGAAPHTIELTTTKTISIDTQIDGGGLITLDGGDNIGILRVDVDVNLDVTAITLARGATTFGGGINNQGGTVSLTNSTVSNSRVFIVVVTGGFGGGIYNTGTLTISNSTISGNRAPNNRSGGGIYNDSGTVVVANSTVSGNRAGNGAAIRNADGTVQLSNTIVANSNLGNNCSGTITSEGGNLSDDNSCNLTELSDLSNTEDNLGPLADNGSPTQTHLPQAGSPAIDNGLAIHCLAVDQRGISRPQGPACDIGAVEVRQDATYLLCASYYTGAVTSPRSGTCGNSTVEITPFDTSFCIDVYTSKLLYLFGRACNPPRRTHTMADDGDLLTCVSLYTGANRWVMSHNQCMAYELANTIPATP